MRTCLRPCCFSSGGSSHYSARTSPARVRPRRSLSSRSAAGNRAEATESAMEVTGLKSMSCWKRAWPGRWRHCGRPAPTRLAGESGRGAGPPQERWVPEGGRGGGASAEGGLCVQRSPHPAACRRHFPPLGVGEGIPPSWRPRPRFSPKRGAGAGVAPAPSPQAGVRPRRPRERAPGGPGAAGARLRRLPSPPPGSRIWRPPFSFLSVVAAFFSLTV